MARRGVGPLSHGAISSAKGVVAMPGIPIDKAVAQIRESKMQLPVLLTLGDGGLVHLVGTDGSVTSFAAPPAKDVMVRGLALTDIMAAVVTGLGKFASLLVFENSWVGAFRPGAGGRQNLLPGIANVHEGQIIEVDTKGPSIVTMSQIFQCQRGVAYYDLVAFGGKPNAHDSATYQKQATLRFRHSGDLELKHQTTLPKDLVHAVTLNAGRFMVGEQIMVAVSGYQKLDLTEFKDSRPVVVLYDSGKNQILFLPVDLSALRAKTAEDKAACFCRVAILEVIEVGHAGSFKLRVASLTPKYGAEKDAVDLGWRDLA